MLQLRFLIPSVALLAGCNCFGGGAGGSGTASAGGASADAAAGGDARAAVIELLEQHRKALLAKDVATLERIWSDDFTFINYRGQLLTRANRLENVRTGATAFKSIQFNDEVVQVHGDSAVLTGVVTLEGQYSGEEGSGAFRFMSVCSRRGGNWQIAALQMTKAGK